MKKEINSNVGPRVNAGGLLAFFLSISFSLVLSGCEHQSAADNAPEVGKTKVESDETKIDKVNGQSIIIVAPETEKALNLKV
ncbi:MAG: hypothetical protein JSS86_24040, partial [Cyanobacteria bacterium SZAS LIN-2]|nr:hypothetical protein [Cyanobacteria bacterium SZAS LIN-2]